MERIGTGLFVDGPTFKKVVDYVNENFQHLETKGGDWNPMAKKFLEEERLVWKKSLLIDGLKIVYIFRDPNDGFKRTQVVAIGTKDYLGKPLKSLGELEERIKNSCFFVIMPEKEIQIELTMNSLEKEKENVVKTYARLLKIVE